MHVVFPGPKKRKSKSYLEDANFPVSKRTQSRLRNLYGASTSTYDPNADELNIVYSKESVSNIGTSSTLDGLELCSDTSDLNVCLISSHPTPVEEQILKTLSDNSPSHEACYDLDENILNISTTSSDSDETNSTSDSSGSDDSTGTSSSEDDDDSTEHSSCDDVETSASLSAAELKSLCISSFIVRHNLTGSAVNDLTQLMSVIMPDFQKCDAKLLSNAQYTVVHYCSACENTFPEDADEFKCSTPECDGLRYKGPQSSQLKSRRQPKCFFILDDMKRQLKAVLEKKDVWKKIQMLKVTLGQKTHNVLSDITDGICYQELCQTGNFLAHVNNISGIFNTDGIPLFSSTGVKLWPIFLAVNEIPISQRFSRDNMILAGIWQGKNAPPFMHYMAAFGEKIQTLYDTGFTIAPEGFEITIRFGVFLGTMDLQAKAYVLEMTMHNGEYGCLTCEEPGIVTKQGKGYARCYPYRLPNDRKKLRQSDQIIEIGRQATTKKKIMGISGVSGLVSMPSFDLVLGIVPEYMHGVLMGVTKNLMYKWFSSTHSKNTYFVGKSIKKISKRLQGLQPPDYVERLPRDLEKHYPHFKATELQAWLLFYCIPCMSGFLPKPYLDHISLLSEGIYLLLGDAICEDDLQRAGELLDLFYSQFADLYGAASSGLNVHNVGSHIVYYVRKWGPLFGWSTFGFEDWNASLLKTIHGTGDVTKQILAVRNAQCQTSSISLDSLPECNEKVFLKKIRNKTKLWCGTKPMQNCKVAGAILTFDCPEHRDLVLQAVGTTSAESIGKVLRVQLGHQKLYCKSYPRMKRRVCYMVLLQDGKIGSIEYFVVVKETRVVYAVIKQFKTVVEDSLAVDHILKVVQTSEMLVQSVSDIVEKLFFMNVDGIKYISRMPNIYGHGVLK